MLRAYPTKKNKNQKRLKNHYDTYLYNSISPIEDVSSYTSAELEAEMLENVGPMRKEFRNITHQLRSRHV